MLAEKVKKTIEAHTLITRGDHIVLGLSGGPDSVCLFHILKSLKDTYDLTIHPVHVNHKFRPGHAEKDQEYVEKICEEAGMPCRSFVVDCNALAEEEGLTSEEAGRKARYDAFHQVAGEIRDANSKVSGEIRDANTKVAGSNVKIAVAQNANDQAETILHRLIRGTGPDGLAGIPYSRMERGVPVIRPLLDITRSEIEEYCTGHQLDPVIDHTNNEPIYTRNRIRLELLPLLEEYNGNIVGALNRLARIAAADREYMEARAAKAMEAAKIPRATEAAHASAPTAPKPTEAPAPTASATQPPDRDIVLRREALAELPDPIRHRVVMMAFEEIGLDQDITEERLVAADAIILKKQGPKTVEFPHGYLLKVAAGKVFFCTKNL